MPSVTYEEVGPYFEIKYTLGLNQFQSLKTVLDHYFIRPDQYDRGTNLTLYYDSPQRSCYLDGLDGALYRQKLRFRKYLGEKNGGAAIFELKEKDINLIRKRRFRFKDGIDVFPKDLTKFIQTLPKKEVSKMFQNSSFRLESLEPAALITYERYRYNSPFSNVRINLDVNIKSEYFYLPKGVKKNNQYFLPIAVLELKSEDYPQLPQVLMPFFSTARKSLSKYVRLTDLALAEPQ